MAFNSRELLDKWVAEGGYPEIHDSIYHAASQHLAGESVLDLCCCFGLLGERLAREYRCPIVWGVDADVQSIAAAKDAGVTIPLYTMKIVPETMEVLVSLIEQFTTSAIVARRAIPELFGENLGFGREFSQRVKQVGVRKILVEGRIYSKRSTNALASLDEEVALFYQDYEIALLGNNLALLEAR